MVDGGTVSHGCSRDQHPTTGNPYIPWIQRAKVEGQTRLPAVPPDVAHSQKRDPLAPKASK